MTLTRNTKYWTKTPKASTPLAACAKAAVCSSGTTGSGAVSRAGGGVRVGCGVCTRLPRGATAAAATLGVSVKIKYKLMFT